MINNIVIMGRLTADPELKTTNSGVSVTAFTVAVDRSAKSKDGERLTDFIPCVAWRGTAEFVSKWFSKGKMIAVAGELQSRKFTDKDGNNRTAFEVIASNVSFCGDSSNNSSNVGGNSYNSGSNAVPSPTSGFEPVSVYEDDDLPF